MKIHLPACLRGPVFRSNCLNIIEESKVAKKFCFEVKWAIYSEYLRIYSTVCSINNSLVSLRFCLHSLMRLGSQYCLSSLNCPVKADCDVMKFPYVTGWAGSAKFSSTGRLRQFTFPIPSSSIFELAARLLPTSHFSRPIGFCMALPMATGCL